MSNNILDLSKDQFGNYVIQRILEKKLKPEISKEIWENLNGQVRIWSIHKYASNVVEKCIEHCLEEDRATLIDELIGDGDVTESSESDLELNKIMDNKYGNYVVQKAIERADSTQLKLFTLKIKSIENKYLSINDQVSNYLKHVINCLEKCNLANQSKLSSKTKTNDKLSILPKTWD